MLYFNNLKGIFFSWCFLASNLLSQGCVIKKSDMKHNQYHLTGIFRNLSLLLRNTYGNNLDPNSRMLGFGLSSVNSCFNRSARNRNPLSVKHLYPSALSGLSTLGKSCLDVQKYIFHWKCQLLMGAKQDPSAQLMQTVLLEYYLQIQQNTTNSRKTHMEIKWAASIT